MRAMTAILVKDLRLRLLDGALLMSAVVLPLGLALLLNTLTGGERAFTASYAVADLDRGPAAAAFADEVLRPMERGGKVTVRPAGTEAEGRALVERGEADAVFVIPAGFSAAVAQGRAATMDLVGDANSGVAVGVAREAARAYAARVGSVRLAVRVAAGGRALGEERAGELARAAAGAPPAIRLTEDDSAATRQLGSATYYAAGMGVFFLFYGVMISIGGIFEERGSGTMARMLAAPIPRAAVLSGKLLAGVLAAVFGMAVLVVASSALMGARWGDPLGVGALVVAGALAATGLMAMVATVARTAEQASNWQSGLVMVLGLFGGALFPVGRLEGFAVLSGFTPHHWFMTGLAELAGGGSVERVLVHLAVLLGFAAVGLAVAVARSGRVVAA
ncbi:ABC transporter permease [Spongiactinospora sp. TRM90649]|uniref:ABC transporter permease n=1 Tax=Spongiactinospora sp. TRM90649 TaxID=3031114 RepID=UPI0023F93549|nr:ABC transporter permease [Spongiactinospora sp. TRM90649]MDF5757983.1 ABC transporter permease [Spongiactinospora sp. TRM90649]